MAKVTVKRAFPEMPNATAGEQIDATDEQVERWTREGHVEASAVAASNPPDRLTRPGGETAPRANNEVPRVSDTAQRAEYDRVNAQRDKQNERMQRDNSKR